MKRIVVLSIAFALCACKANSDKSETPEDGSSPKRPIASIPEEKAEPFACKSDADCPRRACGPCTPGEVVMRDSRFSLSCTVNPCTNSRSICGPKGLCIVHPDTTMTEKLRAEACIKLIRDKWHFCKDKKGDALTACENILDAATARDDASGCEAARARLTE
jgi:hypothetical protein